MLALFSKSVVRVRDDEKGATAVEYGIMVALIAVVIIAAVSLLGGQLNTAFQSVSCSVKGGTMGAAVTAADGTVTPGSCSK